MEKDLKKYYSGLKAKLKKKKQLEKLEFKTPAEFVLWYETQLQKQNNKCHYCKISDKEIYNLVMSGTLTSARFPLNGLTSRGKGRGRHFELDRKVHSGNYSESNCVLACYFCNNDKSDIFSEDQYLKFIHNRLEFLQSLANI